MGRSRPIYFEIRGLRKQLDSEGSVKKCRDAYQRLLELLSDPDTRGRLALEAIPDEDGLHSSRKRSRSLGSLQRSALAEMWKMLVTTAVTCVQMISQGKSKLTEADIHFPFKLLLLCNKSESSVDGSVASVPSNLGKEQTKLLHSYCMGLLGDENIMASVSGAEHTLLSMLLYTCGRREFVSYFKPDTHIRSIIEEIKSRLLKDSSSEDRSLGKPYSREKTLISAKIFATLLCTCRDIGIGLQVLVREIVSFVSSWCQLPGLYVDEVQHMLAGVSVVLSSDPDLCVVPLTQFGRPILQLVKRFLVQSEFQKGANIFSSLLEYLLRHLIVCQVAGKLQGLAVGDLGDLGEASLSYRTISHFLDVLINAVGSHHVTTENLSDHFKLLLELTARLLACAQRIYLVQNESNGIGDLTEQVILQIESQQNPDDYHSIDDFSATFPSASASALSESPFVKLVLSNIFAASPVPLSDLKNQLNEAVSLAAQEIAWNENTLISMLCILCASAEVFPLGNCWMSSTLQNWRVLSTPRLDKDSSRPSSMLLNGCSSNDLVAIVHSVGNVLDKFGGHDASSEVQKWALLSLNRLVVSSDEISFDASVRDCLALANAWRRVWAILHNSSHCYSAKTADTSLHSIGDLALRLLTQMIRYFCTDITVGPVPSSEFLKMRQADVWNLKVFDQSQIGSPALFFLLYIIITRIDVSNSGDDAIGYSVGLASSWGEILGQVGTGRRSKLIGFCLHVLISSFLSRTDEAVLGSLYACLAALVNGFSARTSIVFFDSGLLTSPFLPLDVMLTNVSPDLEIRKHFADPFFNDDDEIFVRLWHRPLCSPHSAACFSTFQAIDDVLACIGVVHIRIFYRQVHCHSKKDYSSESSEINRTVSLVLAKLLDTNFNSQSALSRSSDFCDDEPCPSLAAIGFRMKILKGCLTVLLSSTSTRHSSCQGNLWEGTLKDLTWIFSKGSMIVHADKIGNVELERTLSEFVQIVRGFVLANISLELALPDNLIQAVSSLYNSCEEFLENYVALPLYDCVETPGESADCISKSLSGFDDDFPDFNLTPLVVNASKRKLNRHEDLTSRKKVHSSDTSLRNSHLAARQSAFLIGLIFLELSPTYRDIEFVAKKILGVDVIEDDISSEFDVDLFGAVFIVEVLVSLDCLTPSLMCDETAREESRSLFSLICNIIRMIRSSSGPASTTHIFGYNLCADLVARCDGDVLTASLNRDQAKDLLGLFMSDSRIEKRSLIQRPLLRSQLIHAVTDAFLNSDENFHAEIDNLFGVAFVLPFLSDMSGLVRNHASLAVASALIYLSEDKVAESVRRRLSPVTGKKSDEYRRWYSSKNFAADQDEPITLPESLLWDDAYLGLQYDSISCWCFIAGTTSSQTILQQVLFDLVLAVVTHPKLEALCFDAFARISRQRGFSSVERLLDSEMRNFFERWIASDLSFHDIPLMVCIPSICPLLFRTGLVPFSESLLVHPPNFDLQKVHEVALRDFLRKYGKHIFPLISIFSIKTVAESAITKDGRRLLLEHERFKEYCCIVHGRYNDDLGKKSVRSFIPVILAEACFEKVVVMDELVRVLNGLLTESSVQQKCREGASIACRRMLEIVGEIAQDNVIHDAQESFMTLFKIIGVNGDKNSKSCLDVIRAVGSSIPEMLSMVRFHLMNSCTENQMMSRWKCAVFIFRFVADLIDQSVLGLEPWCAVDFLLVIVMEPKLLPIRTVVLKEFNTFVQCLPKAKEIDRGQRKFVLKRIFMAVMGLHRMYQNDLIVVCSRLHQSHEKKRRRSERVLHLKEGSSGFFGLWNWSGALSFSCSDPPFYEVWSSYRRCVSNSLVDLLIETYNLIDVVVKTSLSVGLKKDILGFFCAKNQEAVSFTDLSRANPSFCAQQLVSELLMMPPFSDCDCVFDELDLRVILSYQYLTDDSILKSALNDFAHSLRVSGAREGRLKISAADERTLVCSLNHFCSSLFPEQTRIAASRCLGEIPLQLDRFNPSCSSPKSDSLSMAISNDRLLSYLQSLVLKSLATSVTHRDPRTAMVAIDSLKCLLSCRVTRSCADTIVDPATSCLLRQIVSNVDPVEWSDLVLGSHEINHLLRRDLVVCDESNKEWCWDDLLWLPIQGSESSSFETWICRLVPSLLVCCYEMPSKFNTNGTTSLFYVLCQRISFLDAATSQALFPCIILDLLLRDGFDCENGELDGVLADTWIGRFDSSINVRLSRCFGLVLQQSFSKHYSKAIEVVIEVLDMLRRLTQHRFSCSTCHKINKRSFKEVKLSNSTGSNLDKRAMAWHGAPFGVVLQLDGLLVANACITIGRFEEAFFYAELFADSRFDDSRLSFGIRCLSQKHSSHSFQSSTRFISGFDDFVDDSTSENDIFSFLETLLLCYASLGDTDSREAVDQLLSDMSFSNVERNTVVLSSILRHPPSLQKLKRLDFMASREKGSPAIRMSIMNCLDGIGLRDSLRTYITGLVSDRYCAINLESSDCDSLQEKMYECRLHAMQWDTVDCLPVVAFKFSPSIDDLKLNICDPAARKPGFYESVVETVDMIRCDDIETGQKCLLNARIRFADKLFAHGSDTLINRNVVNNLDDLRTLNDLEDLLRNPDSTAPLQRIISSVDSVGFNLGKISATSDCIREILMRFYHSKNPIIPIDFWKEIADSHYRRFHGNLQFCRYDEAEASLQHLESVSEALGDTFLKLQLPLLEAKMLESKGDYNAAIRNTVLLVNSLREPQCQPRSREILADALLLCGEWMTRYKVAPAGSILSEYLQPAMNEALLIFASNDTEVHAKRATRALLANGHLVANLFDAVSTRLQSAEWKRAETSLNHREEECDRLEKEAIENHRQNKKKKGQVSTGDDLNNQVYRYHLKREIRATRTQRNTIVCSLEAHRTLAISSIGKALSIAGVHETEDISKFVYRLVGIWFSSEKSWSESIHSVTNEALQGVPSFRFVPVFAQLLSRVANEKPRLTTNFQKALQDLIVKVSHDHPYHCLLPLITLSESRNSLDLNEKAAVASFLLHRISNEDPSFLAELIESYKKLSSAYIYLATSNISELKRNGASNISFEKVCQTSTSRLDKCLGSGSRRAKCLPCVFTKPPMIRPGRDYGDGINDPIGSERVNTFDDNFTITDTGVNQPKIVVCVGTNNGRYKQLVKGADDTRQDAVMEQVFGYANDILSRHRQSTSADVSFTSGQVLRLITYNVVPLSHVAGVLEWVEDSTPFGDFIVDRIDKNSKDGQATFRVAAHSRYYPGEWSSDRCRGILSQIWKEYRDRDTSEVDTSDEVKHKENLRSAFDIICEHHTPVFRYFFVENFILAEAWYAAKMRYTRSVAVSSIVGHILGIGDRHTSNILVHKKTGEVIHIDFGVVFEQGMQLTVPEIVPFRLTRNVIDGMGSIGVEGTFTKAAEATLSGLKQNSSGLLTILSAIVSDPLYKWSVGSKKGNRQTATEEMDDNGELKPQPENNTIVAFLDDHDDHRNQVAAHAISRISEKLSGYEDGTLGEQQSVESQVQLLVNAARSPDNLCCMYPGWAPWQ